MGGDGLCVGLNGLHGNLHRGGGGADGLSDRNRKTSACRTNWNLTGVRNYVFYIFVSFLSSTDTNTHWRTQCGLINR